MPTLKKPLPVKTITQVLDHGLPGQVARRLPDQGLLRAWEQVVGRAIVKRARPVSLRDDGLLVVAVRGSAWQQELSFMAPDITHRLKRAGHEISGLRLVVERTAAPPPPPLVLPELDEDDEARIKELVADVAHEDLRRAFTRLLRAEFRARKASRK